MMKAPWYGIIVLLANPLVQAAGVSDPVGALQAPIRGNDAVNIICSGGFIQQPVYSGTGDVFGTILEDPNAYWDPDTYSGTHYVLLETGDWAGIISNTETRLVLDAPLAEQINSAYRIIPYNTLSTLFGENNFAGFVAGAGLAGSDILMPWDAAAQQFAGYYYYNSLRYRWEDLNNAYAGDTILYPDEAVIVLGRRDHSIILNGTVQLGRLSGFIPGDGTTAIVPNPFPVDMLIQESGLESSLSGGDTFADADWVMAWDATLQAYSDFYYYDSNDYLWRNLDNHPADSDDVIPPGTGVLVIRNSAGDSRWYMDQPFEVR